MKHAIFIGIIFLLLFLPACFSAQPDAIVIGVLAPLSGEHADEGRAVKKGVDLAVKEINQRGFLQQPLRAVYEDSACDADQAVASVQELIIAHGVRLIVGDVCSDSTLAVVPIIEQNNVVLISPGARREEITLSPFVFRTIPSDVLFADFVADSMERHNYHKLAVLHHSSNESRVFAQFLKDRLTAVITEEYDDPTSMRVQLTRIKVNKPDALYIVDNGENLFALIDSIRKAQLDVQLFSHSNKIVDEAITDPSTVIDADSAMEGLIVPSISRGNVVFTTLYKRVYMEKPKLYAAQSYDAVKIAAEALKSVPYLGLSLQKELHVVSIDGATGEIKFDKGGNVAGDYEVFQVVNGTFVPCFSCLHVTLSQSRS
jgi:branched-chain amino acid transport system substrate-binding protein